MKSTLTLAGKVAYSVPMAIFGLFHFMNADGMTGMVPIPGEIFWVYLTGAALIAAAVAIIINKKASLAALLLGVLLLIFAFTIHLPNVMGGDEAQMQMSMPSLLKDIALAGAAFFIAGNTK